jgi:hypothetical protein
MRQARRQTRGGHTLGAVVLILKDTGSALGFEMFRERFTFCVRGPLRVWRCEKEREGGFLRKGERRTVESDGIAWLKSDGHVLWGGG